MPIDPSAVGHLSPPVHRAWDSTDALLYAIAVGAGADDPWTELELTTENSRGVTQQVLPTFGIVLAADHGGLDRIGDYDPTMVVHAGQDIAVHRPLPVAGAMTTTTRIDGVYDKGSGALVVRTSESVDAETGEALLTTRSSLFIRGAGGFGGERGPSGGDDDAGAEPRPADHVVTQRTRVDQALLYRLCGDRNPIHSDPATAEAAGLGRPILHGLCTYGFAARALVTVLCPGRPEDLVGMSARFSAPTLPGDELVTSVWETPTGARFTVATGAGTVVLDAGRATVRRG